MKTIRIPAIVFLFSLSLWSCTNDPDKMGNSTPIDSSNLHGAPGATYGPDNPAAPDAPRYEGQFDTGMQPNTMNSEDSEKARLK